jgi:rRNA maturation endonuclease Nob1
MLIRSRFIKLDDNDFVANDINSLLLVQESKIVRLRERPSGAENRRDQTFQNFINREPSQFERVEGNMTIIHEMKIASNVNQALHRANSASDRSRSRERAKDRERVERARDRRDRDRDEMTISDDDIDELRALINDSTNQQIKDT